MFRAEDLSDVGFLSILFAEGAEPLTFWDKQMRTGRIKRITEDNDSRNDKDKFLCIELVAVNINSTFISTPPLGSGHLCLGITLPVLVLIVKNLKKYFSYQIQVVDDRKFRRRFRLSNMPGFHRRLPTVSSYPVILEEGWNELAVNLAELCSRSYGTQYVETVRIEIHANCRLREVFFCEKFDSLRTRAGRALSSRDPVSISMNSRSAEHENNNNYQTERSETDDSIINTCKQLAKDRDSDLFCRVNRTLETTRNLLSNTISTAKALSEKEDGSKVENSDTNSSTSLSLGERLKRDMYFEKPIEKESISIKKKQSRSISSSSSKSQRK